ncbi:MAG: ABC transporter permease [Caulobacteraceae bacterium]
MTDTLQRPTVWQFQYRVIKALVLREMAARFGLSRLGYLWAFIESGLVMLGILLIFSARGRMAPTNIPMGVFLVTGYPMWFAFSNMWQALSRAEAGGKSLLMFPQITLFDLIIAKFVLEAVTQTAIFILICVAVILFFRIDLPADPGAVLLTMWGCMFLGVGMGLITHAIRRVFPAFETLVSPVRRLGAFVSGVIHTGASVPSYLLGYFSWNPVFHGIEIARQSWHPTYRAPVFDPWYIVLCCIGLISVGLILDRLTRRFVDI